MKSFSALLFIAFAFVCCAQSQNEPKIMQLISKYPPCALQCILSNVGASTCQLTDLNCIKHNGPLIENVGTCIKGSCTVKEGLTAKKYLDEMMGAPVRNDSSHFYYASTIIGSITFVFFALRVLARLPCFDGKWGPDDWVMTIVIMLSIPVISFATVLPNAGLGQDIWFVPFDDVTQVLKLFYWSQLIYLSATSLTKVSILLFYLRIFPDPKLRRAIWITIIISTLYLIGFVTATALQCIPVHHVWDTWVDATPPAHCINLQIDLWISSAFNIALDLVVMVLPLREIQKLAISRRRKSSIILMFLGGLFVTGISLLRLTILVQYANTKNPTWDFLPMALWSSIEIYVGIMVASLPAMRSLQRSLRDRIWPKQNAPSNYYEDTNNSSKNGARGGSQSRILSSIGRHGDKEDFVRLDEYEMTGREDAKHKIGSISSRTTSSFEESSRPDAKSHADSLPLASAGAPMSYPSQQPASHPRAGGRIRVHQEFSVDRER